MTWIDADLNQACAALCDRAGLAPPVHRQPIRAWERSGVDRVGLADGGRVVLKYARAPFLDECRHLLSAADASVPVPRLWAASRNRHTVYLLMDDLGDSQREPDDNDGAAAAALLHTSGWQPPVGRIDLAALPDAAHAALTYLQAAGRVDAPDLSELLSYLAAAAVDARPGPQPTGPIHGELHPTSIHLGHDGRHLLDFAKSFHGPLLFDLASWQGTRNPPNSDRLAAMIDQYLRAGGDPAITQPVAGRPAVTWALAWHRVWAAHWYLTHAVRHNTGVHDDTMIAIVRRQLRSACDRWDT
jgi:Phosphotransferase enzyme family